MTRMDATTEICKSITQEFARATFFTGKLVFEQEKFYQRLLHNETASAIQMRLQWEGITTVILPIRVMSK